MAKTISSLNVVLGATVSPFSNALKGAETAAMSFQSAVVGAGSAIAKLTGAGLALGAIQGVFDKIFSAPTEALAAATRQADAETRLAAVLRATGGAAGFSAQALIAHAAALQKTTTFGDEAIIEFEAVLATFRNVSGSTFTQATSLALDMAAALGDDLHGAAIQLGKALNDPVRGITALRKIGVSFTDQQVAQIKAMQDAGNVAGAQAVVLAELKNEFGGTAEAMAKTPFGKLKQIGNVIGDLAEQVGKTLATITVGLTSAIHFDGILHGVEAGLTAVQGVVEAGVAAYGPTVTRTVDRVYGVVRDAAVAVYEGVAGAVDAVVGYVRSYLPAVLATAGSVYAALLAQVKPLAGQMAASFMAVYRPVADATQAVYDYLKPVVQAWYATSNASEVVNQLVIAVGAAYGVYSLYKSAVLAATVAQYAYSAAAYVAGAAIGAVKLAWTGIVAVSKAVEIAQWAARAAIASGVIQTTAMSIASWTATAATGAWAAASSVATVAIDATRVAIAATAAGQALYEAGQYAGLTATAAYTAVRYAAVTAYEAVEGVIASTVVAEYAYAAAQNIAAAAVAAYTTVQWAAIAAVVAYDGTLAGAVAAYEAVRTVIATTTAVAYAFEAAQLTGAAATSAYTLVRWAAVSAYEAAKTAILTTTALEYAYAAAASVGAGVVLAYTGAKWAATAAVGSLASVLSVSTLAQVGLTVATGLSTAGQWLFSAALSAGGIVIGAIGGLFSAASIATAAWTIATGIATGAQWLLNVALTANPIGIVVGAVAALVIGFGVLAGGIVGAAAALSGLFNHFVNVNAASAWFSNAFEVAKYACGHLQETLQLVGAELALFAVRSVAQVTWAFTTAIPAALKWLGQNWQNGFVDLLHVTETVFENLLINAKNFGVAVWEAIKGNGFHFDWTPLTDGFKSTMTEFPKIAERQTGPLEEKLAKTATTLKAAFGQHVADYKAGKPDAAAADDPMAKAKKDTDAAMAKAKADADAATRKAQADAGKATDKAKADAAAAMKKAQIDAAGAMKPPKMDTTGVTGPLNDMKNAAESAGTAVKGLDAVISGSAESMRTAYAAAHGLTMPGNAKKATRATAPSPGVDDDGDDEVAGPVFQAASVVSPATPLVDVKPNVIGRDPLAGMFGSQFGSTSPFGRISMGVEPPSKPVAPVKPAIDGDLIARPDQTYQSGGGLATPDQAFKAAPVAYAGPLAAPVPPDALEQASAAPAGDDALAAKVQKLIDLVQGGNVQRDKLVSAATSATGPDTVDFLQ